METERLSEPIKFHGGFTAGLSLQVCVFCIAVTILSA